MAVGKEVEIGEGTKVYHPETSNLYGCRIGRECVIGSHVVIQKGVWIGDRVKVQSFSFIPEGVTIEDEVFVGPHVCFTNDLYPRATNPDGKLKSSQDWELTPTLVRRGASIGANSTILCGLVIGEGAIVGAGCVVTKDVSPLTVVKGNPARVTRRLERTANLNSVSSSKI